MSAKIIRLQLPAFSMNHSDLCKNGKPTKAPTVSVNPNRYFGDFKSSKYQKRNDSTNPQHVPRIKITTSKTHICQDFNKGLKFFIKFFGGDAISILSMTNVIAVIKTRILKK